MAPHADYLQKGDVTNDTTPTLSGSSSVAGGTISIYDNGRLIGTHRGQQRQLEASAGYGAG